VAELEAEIARLRSLCEIRKNGEDAAASVVVQQASKIAALESRAKLDRELISDAYIENAKLREALEPFAKAADIKLCGEWRDDERFGQTDVSFHLTFGDLRKARAALSPQNDGKQ